MDGPGQGARKGALLARALLRRWTRAATWSRPASRTIEAAASEEDASGRPRSTPEVEFGWGEASLKRSRSPLLETARRGTERMLAARSNSDKQIREVLGSSTNSAAVLRTDAVECVHVSI